MKLFLSLSLILGAVMPLSAQDTAVVKSALARLNADPAAVPAAATVQAASDNLAIKLVTDKATYTDGEVVTLTLTTPQAGQVSIYYEDAGHNIQRLFPSASVTAEAAAKNAKITASIAAGENLISGDGSVTGIDVVIGPPLFGLEKISAVVTDVEVKDDAPIIAALKKTTTSADAALAVAGAAIRQDAATKSAIGRVNAEGVPTTLAKVGIASVSITTRRKL